MGTEPLARKLAAILYADVAGYSRLTGEDEEGTHRALSARLDAITASIEAHNGAVLHFAGDAVLADFSTVSEALTCAVATQQDLEQRNRDLPEERKVQFRVGVNQKLNFADPTREVSLVEGSFEKSFPLRIQRQLARKALGALEKGQYPDGFLLRFPKIDSHAEAPTGIESFRFTR